MLRKHNRRIVRPAAQESVIVLRPGDVVLLQPKQRLGPNDYQRLAEMWRQRLGPDYPVMVLEGEWKITALRKGMR